MRKMMFLILLVIGCTESGPSLTDSPDGSSDVAATRDTNAGIDGGGEADTETDDTSATNNQNNNAACSDRLAGGDVVPGPQGLMIQVPSVQDICELQRTLDHVCTHHDEINDLVLTSVETWQDGEVLTELKLDVLEAIAPYLDCFPNVFVGTVSEILLPDPYSATTINDPDARWRWILAAREVAAPIAAWMNDNYDANWHWYISFEANLNAFTDTNYRNAYIAMLQQHITDVTAINPGIVSWSPTFWTPPNNLDAGDRAALVNALSTTFDRVPLDWVLIQDHLGVEPSWTCDDALAYHDLVQEAGPDLASVQLNVEYFTIDQNGIGDGDAVELANRVACYQNGGASIGASFEYRYWYETHGH